MERFAEYLPRAPVIRDVAPESPGVVQAIDARAVGVAVVELGGGRRRAEDEIDPAVGLEHLAGIGASVDGDWPLARIHARDEASADAAEARLRAAYRVGEDAPETRDAVLARIAPPAG